jgi:hypothetical protein
MNQSNALNTKWLQRFVMGYVFVLGIGLVFIANLAIVAVVIRRSDDFRGNEATWYFLYLGAIIVFSIAELLQRLSVLPAGALFWAQLAGIGPAFEPLCSTSAAVRAA